MKKKDTALAGALLLVLAGWSAADAAEIYTLDPVIVTAERTDTKELKTPAAVEIITDKQIRETGAANMQEALKFSTGIITSSQGPRGLSQGTMTAKAVIRGVEKGTLVLVNGVPMNQSGMYSLQDIASDSVEKVEIIPITNPYGIINNCGGLMKVKVLFEGKPIPFLKVWGMYEGYSSGDAASVMVSTNRDGEAEFRINHWGTWLLRTRYDRPAAGELADRVNDEHYFSSITFFVP